MQAIGHNSETQVTLRRVHKRWQPVSDYDACAAGPTSKRQPETVTLPQTQEQWAEPGRRCLKYLLVQMTSDMQFGWAAVARCVLITQTAPAVVPMRVTPAVRGAVLTYQCSPWDTLDSSSTICMAASWQLALFRSMAVPT